MEERRNGKGHFLWLPVPVARHTPNPEGWVEESNHLWAEEGESGVARNIYIIYKIF